VVNICTSFLNIQELNIYLSQCVYVFHIIFKIKGNYFSKQLSPFFSNGATAPSGPGPPHYRGFTITLRHTTLGRTRLDEWSARRRDLYLTTHNTHKRQTSMLPAGIFFLSVRGFSPLIHFCTV
jgi:hypothetical protein